MSRLHPLNEKSKQVRAQNETRARIAIRCKKGSRRETGFHRVSNYAQWYWKVLLGPLTISTWESLLSRKFDKDNSRDPFPSLDTLAAELHVDRHTLAGRWRKTKSGQRYWNKGTLE